MQRRRRFKQVLSLAERLAEQAARLRSSAEKLAPGAERESLIDKARQMEAAVRLEGSLASPRLRAP